MAYISCVGVKNNEECALFKNGQWFNQDIIQISTYKATISNGSLLCHGLHSGILITALNLPQDTVGYDIVFKVRTTENNAYIQCGSCNNGLTANDLYNVIHSGVGRISYNNISLNANSKYWPRLMPAGGPTQALFYGDAHGTEQQAVDYYIDEIYLDVYDGTIQRYS